MFEKAKTQGVAGGQNLHFHDLRGTAATKFYVAGLSEREIAEIMGWEEESVRKIIRRYVARKAALKDTDPAAGRGRKENIACRNCCRKTLHTNDFLPVSL